MSIFEILEFVLLLLTYSVLLVTIFLEYVCYKRNIETRETIFFTVSLLVLIIVLSASPFAHAVISQKAMDVSKQLAFVLVGLTTPLNVFTERDFKVNPLWEKGLVVASVIFMMLIIVAFFLNLTAYSNWLALAFLGGSVLASMAFIHFTKPVKRFKNRDKLERAFALAFMVFVPLSLLMSLAADESDLKIGFTLPLVFLLLASNKLVDDIQRLSLINPKIEPKEQNLQNYQFTDREKEIACLLIQGKTYKQIAEELFISIPTVKTHTSNIYRKSGVNTRSEFTLLIIS